jgi:hypothetical protein
LKLYSVFGLFPGSGPVVSNRIYTEISSKVYAFFSVEFDYLVSEICWSNPQYRLKTGSNQVVLVMTKLELGYVPIVGSVWSRVYEGEFITSGTNEKRCQDGSISDKFNMLRSRCIKLYKNSPDNANRLVRKKFKSIESTFNEVVGVFEREMEERLETFICENEYRVLDRFLGLCNAKIRGYGYDRVKIVPQGMLYDNCLITEPYNDMEVLKALNAAVCVFEECHKDIKKFPPDSKIMQELKKKIRTIKDAYIIMGVHDE